MSFTQIKQISVRLNRSQMFVLSTDTSAIEIAASLKPTLFSSNSKMPWCLRRKLSVVRTCWKP